MRETVIESNHRCISTASERIHREVREVRYQYHLTMQSLVSRSCECRPKMYLEGSRPRCWLHAPLVSQRYNLLLSEGLFPGRYEILCSRRLFHPMTYHLVLVWTLISLPFEADVPVPIEGKTSMSARIAVVDESGCETEGLHQCSLPSSYLPANFRGGRGVENCRICGLLGSPE